MSTWRALLTVLLIALALFALLMSAEADGPELGPDTPVAPKPKFPRLDSQLNQMVDQIGEQSDSAIAQRAPLSQDTAVAVSIRTVGSATSTAEFLEQSGGTVAHLGTDWLEAYVPVALLRGLAEHEDVLWVQTIIPPQPTVVSQGASLHRSDIWNAREFTGDGIKVGVIDVGFEGYSSLIGVELPSPAAVRCYTAVGVSTSNLADCETDDVHGTAVAEAVADMAPGASLYLANPSSFGDLLESAEWMVAEGVQVINHSAGWTWAGPGDGTSLFSNSPLTAVDVAVSGGAVWANSAGNAAEDSWIGAFTDADADGWLDFDTGSVEGNSVTLVSDETITAQARWEDNWGSAGIDLDLYLYDSSDTAVAGSVDPQVGGSGQDPYERLIYTASAAGTYYLAVFRFSGSAPASVQLNAFTGQNLEFAVGDTSIVNPAESANPGLLAVGAAYWATPSTIEDFSSLGPTTDGRTKPDIVGADRGDSVTYGALAFSGTSQASPHVAGLAALVLEQFSDLTPEQVADFLTSNADPRGSVPNNTWGFGLAKLPLLAPGAPANVTAVAGDEEATVSWTAPSADGGSETTTYTVSSSPESQAKEIDGSTLSTVMTDLANDTTYTFTVTATNAIGTSVASASSNAVTPANFPPVVTAEASLTTDEGSALDLTVATFTDVGPVDTHTATIDWGDGSEVEAGTLAEVSNSGSVDGTHTYADNGSYIVTVTVADGDSAESSDSLTVTVDNVSPTVTASSDQTVGGVFLYLPEGATFTDPGTDDTHTFTIDWGDGTIEDKTSLAGEHQYDAAGTFVVAFTVTDDDGGSGSDSLQLEVTSAPASVNIPGVTTWGLVALSVLLSVFVVATYRRRRTAASRGA